MIVQGIHTTWMGFLLLLMVGLMFAHMICVFQRHGGDIGWRHSELPFNGFEVM